MWTREHTVVLGVVAVGIAAGVYVVFFRPEPYAPKEPAPLAEAAPASSASDDRSAASPAPPAEPARDGGAPLLDKKRHDEILAALRAMLADAGPARPGAAPAAPPAPPRAGAGTMPANGDALARYIHDRVLHDFFPLGKQCYEDALLRNKRLGGRLMVKFRIIGDRSMGGVVESATIDHDAGTLEDPMMETCVTSSMESVVFDAPPQQPDGGPGEVTVDYPMLFSPDGEPDN